MTLNHIRQRDYQCWVVAPGDTSDYLKGLLLSGELVIIILQIELLFISDHFNMIASRTDP